MASKMVVCTFLFSWMRSASATNDGLQAAFAEYREAVDYYRLATRLPTAINSHAYLVTRW